MNQSNLTHLVIYRVMAGRAMNCIYNIYVNEICLQYRGYITVCGFIEKICRNGPVLILFDSHIQTVDLIRGVVGREFISRVSGIDASNESILVSEILHSKRRFIYERLLPLPTKVTLP